MAVIKKYYKLVVINNTNGKSVIFTEDEVDAFIEVEMNTTPSGNRQRSNTFFISLYNLDDDSKTFLHDSATAGNSIINLYTGWYKSDGVLDNGLLMVGKLSDYYVENDTKSLDEINTLEGECIMADHNTLSVKINKIGVYKISDLAIEASQATTLQVIPISGESSIENPSFEGTISDILKKLVKFSEDEFNAGRMTHKYTIYNNGIITIFSSIDKYNPKGLLLKYPSIGVSGKKIEGTGLISINRKEETTSNLTRLTELESTLEDLDENDLAYEYVEDSINDLESGTVVVTYDIRTLGHSELKPKSKIIVEEKKNERKYYGIESVFHRYSDSGYTCDITASFLGED